MTMVCQVSKLRGQVWVYYHHQIHQGGYHDQQTRAMKINQAQYQHLKLSRHQTCKHHMKKWNHLDVWITIITAPIQTFLFPISTNHATTTIPTTTKQFHAPCQPNHAHTGPLKLQVTTYPTTTNGSTATFMQIQTVPKTLQVPKATFQLATKHVYVTQLLNILQKKDLGYYQQLHPIPTQSTKQCAPIHTKKHAITHQPTQCLHQITTAKFVKHQFDVIEHHQIATNRSFLPTELQQHPNPFIPTRFHLIPTNYLRATTLPHQQHHHATVTQLAFHHFTHSIHAFPRTQPQLQYYHTNQSYITKTPKPSNDAQAKCYPKVATNNANLDTTTHYYAQSTY